MWPLGIFPARFHDGASIDNSRPKPRAPTEPFTALHSASVSHTLAAGCRAAGAPTSGWCPRQGASLRGCSGSIWPCWAGSCGSSRATRWSRSPLSESRGSGMLNQVIAHEGRGRAPGRGGCPGGERGRRGAGRAVGGGAAPAGGGRAAPERGARRDRAAQARGLQSRLGNASRFSPTAEPLPEGEIRRSVLMVSEAWVLTLGIRR
jgi:hypothetical protein